MNRYLLVTLIAVVAIFLSRAQKFHILSPDAVTEERLAKILESTHEKVILYFWQPDCEPSSKVTPMLEEFARSYPKLKLVKIDTSNPDNKAVHDAYNINATPTVVIVQKGKVVGFQWVGPFRDRDQMIKYIKPSTTY